LSRREKKRKVENKMLTSKILRTVRSHEGFWFNRAPGESTGKNALSLTDFAEKLKVVDVQSINFHFSRGDFRRWIQLIIRDTELSIRVNRIPQNIRGEKPRSNLIRVVNERIIELKKK
jgi:hypothetical protein